MISEDRACEEVEDCEIVNVTSMRDVKTQEEVCVGKSGVVDL